MDLGKHIDELHLQIRDRDMRIIELEKTSVNDSIINTLFLARETLKRAQDEGVSCQHSIDAISSAIDAALKNKTIAE